MIPCSMADHMTMMDQAFEDPLFDNSGAQVFRQDL